MSLSKPRVQYKTLPFAGKVAIIREDENVEVYGALSDQDILSEVLSNKKRAEEDDMGDEIEAEEAAPNPTSFEALAAHIGEFRRYVEGQTNVSEAVFCSLNMLEDFVSQKRLNSTKQTELSHFFRRSANKKFINIQCLIFLYTMRFLIN